MTIASQVNKVVYAADGITTAFTYVFRADNDSDIKVYIDSSLQSSGYVLTRSVDDIGGVVTFSPPPIDDKVVTLLRELDSTQEIDYLPLDAFPAETHEAGLDKLTMLIQQVNERADRAISAPIGGDTATDFTLPSYDSGKGLMWDEVEQKIINTDSQINNIVSQAQAAQSGAEAAEAGAALILDTFDDRYLGEKASDPVTDNDGDPLIVSSEYWNTTVGERRTWTGSAWIASGASTASGIINVPAGDIIATNVQAAINELDAEKQPIDPTFYKRANILGAVTEAAGVPTGAIIERGSNANGEYIKFADGTMICQHTISWVTGVNFLINSVYISSSSTTWTFPATFSSPPQPVPSMSSSSRIVLSASSSLTTSADIVAAYWQSLPSTTLTIDVTAIGRWF